MSALTFLALRRLADGRFHSGEDVARALGRSRATLSEALKRRCLHLYIDFPGPEEEARIITLKVPELEERLRRQVARFVNGLRKLDVKKAPSIAETLDWARALVALGVKELDAPTIKRTLNIVLKYEEDIRKAEGRVGDLLRASQ